jgi:hypothetical protein
MAFCALLGACTASSTEVDATATAPVAAQSAADLALLQQLCAMATCAGPLSVVTVYRTADGEPALYVHRGDLGVCSHPPWTYFDAFGEQVLVQPERPVSSMQEADQFANERNEVLANLVKSEELSCGQIRGGSR